jgi:endogenous inhibitor of DNA gyrase (YacG/DUF329 family)
MTKKQPARITARCPICGKPQTDRYRPFCSARCADIDLGRWFGEAYRVPGAPTAGSEPAGENDDETG